MSIKMPNMIQIRSFIRNHFFHILIYQLSMFSLLFLYLSLRSPSEGKPSYPVPSSLTPSLPPFLHILFTPSSNQPRTNISPRPFPSTAPRPPQMGYLPHNRPLQREIQNRHPPRSVPGFLWSGSILCASLYAFPLFSTLPLSSLLPPRCCSLVTGIGAKQDKLTEGLFDRGTSCFQTPHFRRHRDVEFD